MKLIATLSSDSFAYLAAESIQLKWIFLNK